jgi:NADP-reducing hydrogenase subunit HndB
MGGLDFLEKVDIFKGLNKDQLKAINKGGREKQYLYGDRLFAEGEKPFKYALSAYSATKACKILQINKDHLLECFEKDPRMGLKFMTNVAAITSGHFDRLQESVTVSPVAKVKITVHMSTCGIAAGARQVMSALVEEISGSDRPDIEVASSGCIGQCKNEPNITVEIGGGEPVIYQKMTPDKMRQIFQKHILGGDVQTEFVLA